MAAGGSRSQGGDKAAGVALVSYFISLCLVYISFRQACAIFLLLFPLLVITVTPTIENISAMSMCLTSSQKHSCFFASAREEILEKFQLLQLLTQFTLKYQCKLHAVLLASCNISIQVKVKTEITKNKNATTLLHLPKALN